MFHSESTFITDQFTRAAKCDIPKCEVCQYAKAHCKSTKGNVSKVNPVADGTLQSEHLRAGASVSVDHFESQLKGQTGYSRDQLSSDKYIGG